MRNAIAFLRDLSGRLSNWMQFSSDAPAAYLHATEAFGLGVDYGQILEFYRGRQWLEGQGFSKVLEEHFADKIEEA